MYVAEYLTFNQINNCQSNKYEHLWVDINCNNKIYSINALYRPSTDNTADKYEEFLNKSEIILNNLKNYKSDIKIIASDLNFGNVYCKQPILLPKPLDNSAPELYASFGFKQLIDIPTRVRENTISLVDLFFVSCIDTVKSHGTLPPIADHDGIFTSFINVKTQYKPVKRTVFDYKNANENGLIKYISEYDYTTTVFSKPISAQAEALSDVLINARNMFIPTKEITIRPNDQPWTNTYTRLLMRCKNRNYQIFKKISIKYTGCLYKQSTNYDTITRLKIKKDKLYTKYKTSLNESNKANRRCKLNFFNTINATMKNAEISAKKKFSIMTKLMKSQKVSTVPHLKEGDTVITNSQDKCNIFNDFFSSKATVSGANDPVPKLPVNDSVGSPLNTISTSYIEVAKFCRDIKKSYSSHCGIPGKFVSMIATPLSFPLTQIFNNMFSAGIFPDIFKIAHICCIYKRSGVKSDKTNW